MINKDGFIVPEEITEPVTESSVKGDVPSTQMIRGNQIYLAPQPKLTASDGTLANAVIRIGELESALKKLGLLKTN